MERLLPTSNLDPCPNISCPKTNLPILPTPLIGRQREMDELPRLLRDPRCRLLTLVGPGGIGKTRLALEVAAGLQKIFADDVFFIPLASINSTRFIIPMIADAVGFSFQSTDKIESEWQLFNHLKEKQILLMAEPVRKWLTMATTNDNSEPVNKGMLDGMVDTLLYGMNKLYERFRRAMKRARSVKYNF